MHNRYERGDLVCVPSLPRRTRVDSCVWKPDPRGSFVGIVVDVDMSGPGQLHLMERVSIQLASGELITLSTNMIEYIQPATC
jgi:hypothetical protein